MPNIREEYDVVVVGAGHAGCGAYGGVRRGHPHRPGSRQSGGCGQHGGGVYQPPAGGDHHQGALADRHEHR